MKWECGLDEAGRGCIAGPVAAGCVVLPADFPVGMLDDSKKLSKKARESAYAEIVARACWGFGIVDNKKIDEINILQASLLAMKIAYEKMSEKFPKWAEANGMPICGDAGSCLSAVVDGNFVADIPCEVRCEPKADGNYPSVMAASIIAKVGRDALMDEFDAVYPGYGYAKHKGYPTKSHLEICRSVGPSPIQRLSFDIRPKSEKASGKKKPGRRDDDSFLPGLFD